MPFAIRLFFVAVEKIEAKAASETAQTMQICI
jgi:hypothetical protein